MRAQPERAGAASGFLHSATLTGSLVGPILFSLIVPEHGYAAGWMIVATFGLAAGVVLLSDRGTARRTAGCPPPRCCVTVLRNLVLDTRPLRSRPFRWLILGQFGGQFARQLLVVAVPYQVFVETGSTFLVGLLGLLQVGPVLVCSLLGGVIADAYDRRGVLIVTQLLAAASTLGLALNAQFGPIWPVFVLATLNASFAAVESPARTAIVPSLTSIGELPAAFALNQLLNRTMQVVGPAFGGLVLAVAGIGPAYLVACGWAAFAACAIRPIGRQRKDVPAGAVTLEALATGWRYVRRTPVLVQTLLVDFNAMVFGMPRAIFPLIGTSLLGGGAGTVGLLYAAPGAGAMLAALTMGWVHAVRRQGRLVVWSVVVWGVSIAAFGLSRTLVSVPAPARGGRRRRRGLECLPHHDPAGGRARPAPRAGDGFQELTVDDRAAAGRRRGRPGRHGRRPDVRHRLGRTDQHPRGRGRDSGPRLAVATGVGSGSEPEAKE